MTDFGVLMFAPDYAIQPIPLARAAEERGFESLFFPEHTHIPASRLSPWPGGAELPQEYWRSHDPFVSLSAAAAATKTLKVGSARPYRGREVSLRVRNARRIDGTKANPKAPKAGC